MLTKSLKISDTTETEFFQLKIFYSDKKKKTKLLPFRFQQCFRPFNMLTVHKCSENGIFSHLSDHAFCSLYFLKYISYEAHLFFEKVQNFLQSLEVWKKVEQILLALQIIAFELIALNTHFYRETILLIRNQYVSKQSQDFRYY